MNSQYARAFQSRNRERCYNIPANTFRSQEASCRFFLLEGRVNYFSAIQWRGCPQHGAIDALVVLAVSAVDRVVLERKYDIE